MPILLILRICQKPYCVTLNTADFKKHLGHRIILVVLLNFFGMHSQTIYRVNNKNVARRPIL